MALQATPVLILHVPADRRKQLASCGDPSLPLSAAVVDEMAALAGRLRPGK
jgi:hypothetical protein